MAIRTRSRTPLLAALAVSGALALASCSAGAPNQQPQRSPEPVATSAAPMASGDPSTDPSASAGGVEGLSAALAAIELAESATGAVAFEIDDQDDDRAWEVTLADGERQLTVIVSGDGSQVVSTAEDDEVDAADRSALDSAQVAIAEAIETAADEVGDGAAFDDASLEDHGGDSQAWEVSFEDETDVMVSIEDGSVLRD
ncbi:hypothetical protein [Agrococcus sp. HG114]|uniref:hypothetical protein n=1 Tax=Agrococcus sp. HG114 TaxID=2969757 RepID=UPI00215A79DD|nr:hypothetical protein [Agrococcus sp. HG114]MCR8671085.1 hypothetical protein [Agrococcus sp. HG114]